MTRADLSEIARVIRNFVTERLKPIEERLARADEQQQRTTELEARLAGFEKRTANLENTAAAHRAHLRGLEEKFGKLKRGES